MALNAGLGCNLRYSVYEEEAQVQLPLADASAPALGLPPVRGQLLKWIGNKQRFATGIIAHFPREFRTYREPFLGSGAVLAALAPRRGVGSDAFAPLVEIWRALHSDPKKLKRWYRERLDHAERVGKEAAYEAVRASYNAGPNGADLLFLSRVCYGGVVRFRKNDGYMSTPCGPHKPMPLEKFAGIVDRWHQRVHGCEFEHLPYQDAFAQVGSGDVVYCDPPYADSQAILYGAQAFRLAELYDCIAEAKAKGAYVALSIDGTKRNGSHVVDIAAPPGLFKREVVIEVGRSMLKRFQRGGEDVADHHVTDRLLLTY